MFFKQLKLDCDHVIGRFETETTIGFFDVGLTLTWNPEYSTVGMFLEPSDRRLALRFLMGEKIVEFETKDFGRLWTVRKPGQ